MKRLLPSISILTLALVGGAYLWNGGARADSPQIAVAPVTRGSVVARVSATGTLEPIDTVEVGTQVSGTIATLAPTSTSQSTAGRPSRRSTRPS